MTPSPLTLRPAEPADLALHYKLENLPEVWDVCTPGGPYSHYALEQYLASQPADLFASGQLRMVACLEGGESIGTLDLLNYSPTDRSAEVGIALLREYRGMGYGREMLRQLEEHARRRLNLRMLYAKISACHNATSRHLFLSAGFREVALLPSWHFRQGQYEDLSVMQKIIAPLCPSEK